MKQYKGYSTISLRVWLWVPRINCPYIEVTYQATVGHQSLPRPTVGVLNRIVLSQSSWHLVLLRWSSWVKSLVKWLQVVGIRSLSFLGRLGGLFSGAKCLWSFQVSGKLPGHSPEGGIKLDIHGSNFEWWQARKNAFFGLVIIITCTAVSHTPIPPIPLLYRLKLKL